MGYFNKVLLMWVVDNFVVVVFGDNGDMQTVYLIVVVLVEVVGAYPCGCFN